MYTRSMDKCIKKSKKFWDKVGS